MQLLRPRVCIGIDGQAASAVGGSGRGRSHGHNHHLGLGLGLGLGPGLGLGRCHRCQQLFATTCGDLDLESVLLLRLRVTPEALCWETANPLNPLCRGRANSRGHGSRGGAPANGRALGLEQKWVRDGCDAWKTCVEMRPSRKPAFAESEAHTHPGQKPAPIESEANHACTVEGPPQAPK